MRSRTLFLVVVLLSAVRTFAATYDVTTNADAGSGSLRQGILDANSGACAAPCTIAISVRTIAVQTPLPPIVVDHVTITAGPGRVTIRGRGPEAGDGLRVEGAEYPAFAGLALTGFRHGVVFDRAKIATLSGCELNDNRGNGMLVVDSGGIRSEVTEFSGNGANGVYATRSSGIRLGVGTMDGNVANGVHLHDTDFAEVTANRLVGNGHNGIVVTGARRDVLLEANVFRDNGLLAIDIGGDGVTTQEAPVLTSATLNRGWLRVIGTIRSRPNSLVWVHPYVVGAADPSGHGEGEDSLAFARGGTFAQRLRTDANGDASFTFYFSEAVGRYRGREMSAIATHLSNEETGAGSTSEFARNVPIVDDEVKFVVSTAADAGPGSLRAAIEEANASEECLLFYPCAIAFRIEGDPATIQPRTQLPAITRDAVWIDGEHRIEINGALCAGCNGLEVRGTDQQNADAVLIRRLTINGFEGAGVLFSGGAPRTELPSRVDGCLIGTDRTGTRAVPNGVGVRIENAIVGVGAAFDNRVDTDRPSGCVISGNRTHGIVTDGPFSRIVENRVGTDVSGFVPLPNGGSGIHSGGGVMQDNLIAFNIERGVFMTGGTAVTGGAIHSNGGRGIELADRTLAGEVPRIVLARAADNETRIAYEFQGEPPATVTSAYLISFYAGSFTDTTGSGEGRRFIASTFDRADMTRPREVVVRENLAGKFITATATPFDLFAFITTGTTTEFSPAAQVTTGSCPQIAPIVTSPPPQLRWTPIDGATEYRVWTMKFGDEPRIAYRGTASEATLALAPGTYDWVVEARFDPCYGTQSTHGVITVK